MRGVALGRRRRLRSGRAAVACLHQTVSAVRTCPVILWPICEMDGEWLVGWLIMSDCVEKKKPTLWCARVKFARKYKGEWNLQGNIYKGRKQGGREPNQHGHFLFRFFLSVCFLFVLFSFRIMILQYHVGPCLPQCTFVGHFCWMICNKGLWFFFFLINLWSLSKFLGRLCVFLWKFTKLKLVPEISAVQEFVEQEIEVQVHARSGLFTIVVLQW